ncbi:sialidase family protein [Actinokineospora sp.]|uniref:sialidase family protein n=1 Tax=Actinokineospora sp. TaxID=1872133 RepID=UPI003D69FF16
MLIRTLGTFVAVILLAFAVPAEAAPPRQLLEDVGSSYPRVIRLEHGPGAGRIITSIGSMIDGKSVGLIHESTDRGRSFHRVAVISDPDLATSRGMCCATLYELPRQVGDMPAGTLLWATTAGLDAGPDRRVRQRVWRSADIGRTWTFLSDIAIAPNAQPGREPELSVAADGSLVAFYSDESDTAHHDQKLVRVRSTDGKTWGEPVDTVKHQRHGVRPGMIGVRALPGGTYFMVYEVCNIDLLRNCGIYFRTSTDGWDWGDPIDLGTQVITEAGRYPRHTPTVAWSPNTGSDGAILLISEMLVEADGSLAPGNGATILVNDPEADDPWEEFPAPIQVTGVNNEGCRNFSPSLLPSRDGRTVLELATDLDNGVCKTFVATGPIPID